MDGEQDWAGDGTGFGRAATVVVRSGNKGISIMESTVVVSDASASRKSIDSCTSKAHLVGGGPVL